jgi:hypothetical protein
MMVSNTYGSMQSPSENTDIVGSLNSPQGVSSSLLGYINVENTLTGYITPTNTTQNFKYIAIHSFQGGDGNIQAGSFYGANKG